LKNSWEEQNSGTDRRDNEGKMGKRKEEDK